jgi:peptide/nickel transport system substrate-binding protein
MYLRSKSLGVIISALVIVSMGLWSVAKVANAASPGHKAAKTHAAAKSRCKTRDKASGSVRFSDWQFPDNLNSYQNSQVVAVENEDMTGATTLNYNSAAHHYSDLLTKIPSQKNGGISKDGKTITLILKPGVMWSDGKTEHTAAQLKFGWQINMNAATGPACKGTCDVISKVDVKGTYTAIYHLKSVYAPILDVIPSPWPLAWPNGWSQGDVAGAANRLAQDTKYTFEDKTYPTDGPYQPTEFTAGNRIVYDRMPYYSAANCGAYVAQLIFAFWANKATMIAAAANKQTDLTEDYTPADIPELLKHTDAYKLGNSPSFLFEHLELNHDATYNGKPNPLANAKVRVALALALDKLGLVSSALGISTAAAKGIIAWTPLVNTATLHQPFVDKALVGQWDPLANKGKGAYTAKTGTGAALADAKKLLTQAGFPSGFTVDFMTTPGNPVRAAQEQIIANNWAKIGVTVNPSFPANIFADFAHGGPLYTGAFQVGMFAFSGNPDPFSFQQLTTTPYIDRAQATHSVTNQDDAAISDPVINKAMKQGIATIDPAKRQAAYNAFQVQMNKEAHWIELYYRPLLTTNDGAVKTNFYPNPGSLGKDWNAQSWNGPKQNVK